MIKLEQSATAMRPGSWQLLPMRFHRLDGDSVLLTNLVGEHVFVSDAQLLAVMNGTCHDQGLLGRLRAVHLIQAEGETLPAELLAIKLRTRMSQLPNSTGLHIFVVTLRCEHTCRYCQVSRQAAAKSDFDMSDETARKSLGLAFRTPSPHLKIEFQGGEPLLNFPLIRRVVLEAERMNAAHGKDLAFVIATNLALLDDEILDFCAEHRIFLSTSLDGPGDLHNANRRRPGQDSWQQAVTGIRRATDRLGADWVSALMTTT
ncbi:MAG TPA: radical SAM protein, partial [Trebonia sp.]